MRGTVTGGNDSLLKANLSDAESSSAEFVSFTSTGFKLNSTDNKVNGNNHTYIYMAIRRPDMSTPTSASDVFDVDISTQAINSSNAPPRTPFPVDMGIYRNRNDSGVSTPIFARLQGANYLQTNAVDTEGSGHTTWDQMDGWGISTGSWESSANYVFYNWKRAPGYFDVVAYTGTGTAGLTVNHNLGVAPEMTWVKRRDSATNWRVNVAALGTNGQDSPVLRLNLNNASEDDNGSYFGNNNSGGYAAPTSSVLTLGGHGDVNASGGTYIAYLFATVAGVSKVGSYTGNGSSQNIDCGFSSGAKFVLIKKTNSNGSWIFFDSVRGIVSGNDPYLFLNNTNAEGSGYDLLDPYASGFNIASSDATINASGDSYIFYAIAA